MRKVLKFFVVIFLIIILAWYICPIGENQKKKYANQEMKELFTNQRINANLFFGPKVIYENKKEWFEWAYLEGNEKILIRIFVPRFRFLSLDNYMLGEESLWQKVYDTAK